jgi:hypothetical protein
MSMNILNDISLVYLEQVVGGGKHFDSREERMARMLKSKAAKKNQKGKSSSPD